MSEELLNTPEGVNLDNTSTEIETDPYEQEARSQGWVPKEEYQGDPGKWRGSKEFVERGELFGKIDSLGKELKETKKALTMLQDHHTKVKETEYKRAVDELKALQKQHLEEGNSDGYIETTELLTELKAEQAVRKAQEDQPKNTGVDPRFVQWVNDNRWYNADQEMREYADTLGLGFASRNPNMDPEDVLKYVTSQVKSRFKDKFQNPNRNKPSTVEGTSNSAPVKVNSFELSEEEKKVMNTFVRAGVMSKDEYIAQVKSMRGV